MSGSASAPGSSANLGPGFDVLALAIHLRCHVTAEPAAQMTVDDGDGPVELDDDHIIFKAVMAIAGGPMALTVANEVPRTRGLGSSAAVTTAAAAASARAIGTEPDRDRLYEIIAAIEGHGDNAAAALFGGLMAAGADGPIALPISDALIPVVGVPREQLPTGEARASLDDRVSLATAARSVGRAVALVDGLRTGDPATLTAARGDELHEAPRSALSPVTGVMIEAALDAGALHAAWSGAGPTAIALATHETSDVIAAALRWVLGDDGEVLVLGIDHTGLI